MRFATLAIALFTITQTACQPSGGPKEAPSSAPSTGPAPSGSASTPAKSARSAPVREGNVVARAAENDALFIADEDHSVLHVVALPAELKSQHVDFQVPGRPAQVLATEGEVLVSIRQVGDGEGALLILKRKPGLDLEEVGRVPLPADAWGIAITPDEKTAIVSSAWTHRLSAVALDGKPEVKWSVDVAREPRGVVVMPAGDRAYVSHLVGSDVTRVDGIASKEPVIKRVELPASPLRSPYNVKLPASLGYAAVASPSGDRVFFPRHALGALGPDAWFGVGAVDVLDAGRDMPLAPARSAAPTAHFVSFVAQAMPEQKWLVGSGPVIERTGNIQEPRAIAYRKRTDTILVANEGSDDIVELDALAMDPTLGSTRNYQVGRKYDPILHVPERGGVPSGIALSEQEDEAYVFCRGTYDLMVVKLAPEEGYYHSLPPLAISLAPEETKLLRVGRALFYKGDNETLSGGLSCAACHPEGRDDGHTWHEVKFTPPDGGFTNFFAGTDLSAIKARWGELPFDGEGGFGYARQTPMLAGRVKAAGPYGWHGESKDLRARMVAGFDLHRWRQGSDNAVMKGTFADYLSNFLREGLVPPPRVAHELTEEESKGKAIFESPATQCATCHVPASELTDRQVVPLRKIRPPQGYAEDPNPAYKTPSLLYVGGSAPYLHDGRFESLESLIEYNQDRMGKTAQLSADERKALIAYLRTL